MCIGTLTKSAFVGILVPIWSALEHKSGPHLVGILLNFQKIYFWQHCGRNVACLDDDWVDVQWGQPIQQVGPGPNNYVVNTTVGPSSLIMESRGSKAKQRVGGV